MAPTEFPGQNVVFAENQPEYLPLPALKVSDGTVVTCWRLTWAELLKLLFTRKLWLLHSTFNTPLQPIFPTIDNPVVLPSK